MTSVIRYCALLALVLATLVGCTQSPVTQPLRSLELSGEVTFLCTDPTTAQPTGLSLENCPDRVNLRNHMLALVTQTARGEVAVIDLSAGDKGEVVDVNPSVPGFNFLPVGAEPVDIVSTPGGTASFVATAEVGRPGIFALPTSCVGPPRAGEHVRDLTSWPACALPSAPSDLSILIQPEATKNDCSINAPFQPASSDCTANVTDPAIEKGPLGVRKLAVTLPDRGSIAIIDAQELLNRAQGSFDDCKFEQEYSLPVFYPTTIQQSLPPDLQKAACTPPALNYGPSADSYVPYPVKQAIGEGDTTLYIADSRAPVIHALDVTSPCKPVYKEPLRPVSLEEPGRVVTTRELAVSPVTTNGRQRFLYAIDDDEGRGSVMAFDISPGVTDRTPIVRPGSPRMPYEPPDRILFSAPARALSFAQRDVFELDGGFGAEGTPCDPDPRTSSNDVGTKYRPAADLSSGAAPRKLRGVFGFAALASGQVAVIDVEDYDAKCRRPRYTNHSSVPDFRGCANDPGEIAYYTVDQSLTSTTPTVTDEVSCTVVQPHRARSSGYELSNTSVGVRAPSIRALPRLSSLSGGLTNDNTVRGRVNPKLLAVNFDAPPDQPTPWPAQVYVGTSLYRAPPLDATKQPNPDNAEQTLELNPGAATRNSVALPLVEPRSYASQEDYTVTYEGRLTGNLNAGYLKDPPPGSPANTVLLSQSANFCDVGVEDVELMKKRAADLQATDADRFANAHADYVQILTPIPDADDKYWGYTASCGMNRAACVAEFGEHDVEVVSKARDFRIVEAYQGHLLLEPRVPPLDPGLSDAEKAQRIAENVQHIKNLRCCFATANTFTVRAGSQWLVSGSASGVRHDIFGDPNNNYRCARNKCDPRLKYFRSRAFEISSTTACPDVSPEDANPPGCIGPVTADDVACTVASNTQGVVTPSPCVFENLTARFAIYRGTNPSVRDMTFSWQTLGGFTPLAANIADQTSFVSPRSMMFVKPLGQLAVVDGQLAGLTLVDLSNVAVSRLYF